MDTSVSEQELVYVLFLSDGLAVLKFLSIKNPQSADAPHLVDYVKDAFHHFGIADFSSDLHGLNVDGARAYSKPILHSTIEHCPLLRKLCIKALFYV